MNADTRKPFPNDELERHRSAAAPRDSCEKLNYSFPRSSSGVPLNSPSLGSSCVRLQQPLNLI